MSKRKRGNPPLYELMARRGSSRSEERREERPAPVAPPDLPDELSAADKQRASDAKLALDALGEAIGGDALRTAEIFATEPKELGDFRIVRQIGRGGMGIVFEAEQLSMGRKVALKTLPLATMIDPKRLARFKNEVRAVATLDHGVIALDHSRNLIALVRMDHKDDFVVSHSTFLLSVHGASGSSRHRSVRLRRMALRSRSVPGTTGVKQGPPALLWLYLRSTRGGREF